MDRQTLDLFCRQLAHWAEAAIEKGRSPFRRAETFCPLLTAAGEISPPLILWINRDSFMAGATVFFPTGDTEKVLADGRACAQALGLRHFVTWAAREITIWEAAVVPSRCRTLPVPQAGADSPALFCDLFRGLLEELKPLAVSGAIPAPELSPFYQANLCRHTLYAITPFLVEAFRITAGEARESRSIPAQAARQQSYLILLRLLALQLHDRLPPAIDPEGFDRALRFAIDTLPPALRQSMEIQGWEIPLPPAAGVRLQHLARRLLQLGFAGDRDRGRDAVAILLQDAAGNLGGAPLPALDDGAGHREIVINPDRCLPASAVSAEVASPALLAFTALLRHLQGETPVNQAANPFLLGEAPPPSRIRGTIPASPPPEAAERHALVAQLRRSWPNRRFPLPADSPRWVYEFLHLLGLSADGGKLGINLPDDWLTAPWGTFIHSILCEYFVIARLERRPERVKVELQKGNEGIGTTRILGAGGERSIPWAELREASLSFLPLALDLPTATWTLLQEGKLRLPKEWPSSNEKGIYLFSRSSVGRSLWHTVAGGRPLPPRNSLFAHLQRYAFPLPEPELLNELQLLNNGREDEPGRDAIDRIVANWWGAAAETTEFRPRRRKTSRPPAITEELLEKIRVTVFVDGLPHFPEHYLYDFYRPEMIEYRFSGRLTPGEEFLGQRHLRDRAGNVLTVEGEETARALLLASYAEERPIYLPADRHLTAKILDRHVENLRRLRRALIRESHRVLSDPGLADAACGRIWEGLHLPPWPLIVESGM